MNDRIKLAEAMGYKQTLAGWSLNGVYTRQPKDLMMPTVLPDPFTDANHDYAVLEWMRRPDGLTPKQEYEAIMSIHEGAFSLGYQIGNYARAALKVLAATDTDWEQDAGPDHIPYCPPADTEAKQ